MENNITENGILDTALKCLTEKYPFNIQNRQITKEWSKEGAVSDAGITVLYGDHLLQLNIEIISRFDKAAAALLHAKQGNAEPVVVVTPYISSEMADRMRTYGIEFIDTCGNVFINRPPVYIFVKGHKANPDMKPEPRIRAFKTSGLKIIFTLLSVPDSVQKTFRELANLSNVSLGTVNGVINDLNKLGYIIDAGNQNRILDRTKELFDRWVTTYPEELKTKLNRKTFRPEDTQWWKKAEPDRDEMWSGEIAAAKLTGYLTPGTGTLYSKPPYTKLAVKYRLRNDPKGQVEILEKFWNFDQSDGNGLTVPPILIYADLISTGDARTIETARIIYNEYIAQLIGKA